MTNDYVKKLEKENKALKRTIADMMVDNNKDSNGVPLHITIPVCYTMDKKRIIYDLDAMRDEYTWQVNKLDMETK